MILENSGQNDITFLLSACFSPRDITGIFDKTITINKINYYATLIIEKIHCLKKGENNPILLDIPLKNKK
jgi:hypothetical protein